jgi:hypothetical protein
MSPLCYPSTRLERMHGPRGYSHYERYRSWLRDEFKFRCIYCLRREKWSPRRGAFHIDHFIPQAKDPNAILEYDNLLYSCHSCNLAKLGSSIEDPCEHLISSTVVVHPDGRIEAHSKEARRIVEKLQLDAPDYEEYRFLILDTFHRLCSDPVKLSLLLMGYPDDLPDLRRLQPPDGNFRPTGLDSSCFELKRRGLLPSHY